MTTLELVKLEAEVLFDQHGLGRWTLEISNRKKRAMGCCFYREKLIWISLVHCEQDNRADVLDTLLHEIAHALIPPSIEGTPHGPQWRAKAGELGCSNRAIENNGRIESASVPGRWFAVCPGCSKQFNWYREVKNKTGRFCRPCGPEKGSITITERLST